MQCNHGETWLNKVGVGLCIVPGEIWLAMVLMRMILKTSVCDPNHDTTVIHSDNELVSPSAMISHVK